jgi:predicted RNase H-like HicB family nuclease
MSTRLKAHPKPLTFQVTFFVEADEDRYHAWAPLLPGLHADGTTASEALQQACELAQLYLEVLIEDGDPIPLGLVTEAAPAGAAVHQEPVTVSAL